jgi:hypothetical protein
MVEKCLQSQQTTLNPEENSELDFFEPKETDVNK